MSELNRRSGGSDDPTPPRNDKSATDQPGEQNAPDAGTTPGRPPRPGDHRRAETFNSVDEARAALPRNINNWSPGNPRHVQAMRYLQSAEGTRTGAGPENREQRRDTQSTPPRPESPSAEIAGLHARAATDRGDLARHDRQPAGHADARPSQDGPTGSDDPERGSDDDRTDHNAPPGDRPENDDPEKPADASGGDGRDGDAPKTPPPDDPGPDEGDAPDELAAAKARIAELEKEVAKVKAENTEKDATIGRLQDTCTYLDRRREAAETKAAEQSTRVDALTDTVGELTSKVDDQSTQIETLTGKLDELGTMLGDALKQMKSPEQAKPDARAEDRQVERTEERTLDDSGRNERESRPKRSRMDLAWSAGDVTIAGGELATSVASFTGAAASDMTVLYMGGGVSAAGFLLTVGKAIWDWRKGSK